MWKRLEEKSGERFNYSWMEHLQLYGDYIYIIYIFNLYMCMWIKWGDYNMLWFALCR
jgi:hypothetical protein